MSSAPRGLTFFTVILAAAALTASASDLTEAAKRDDAKAVQTLIRAKADVNQPEVDGTTALHWAVRNGDERMVAALVAAGARVNVANRPGLTPIALAAESGSAAIVEMLLKAGADANAASKEGETVLMTAARAGDAAVVRALLARGATPNVQESWREQTALMWAASEGHAAVVDLLVGAGADVNARSKVLPGQPRLPRVQGVAAQNAHSNFPRGGFTPLLFTARDGSRDAARALAVAGADLNLADPDGIPPVSMAIINGHYDLAADLLDRGANPNAADRSGRTPIYFATDMHTLEWLFSRPVPRPSGDLDSVDIVKRLIAKGADVNARLTGRTFILHHNATGNRTLIEGSTPLMKAATTSDLTLIKVLLDAGADPALFTKNRTTPLMALSGLNWVDISSLGTEEDSIEAMKLLLARGADVNAANELGETAAHAAAQRGADKVLQFLADRGATLDMKNRRGRTPMDEALGQLDEQDEESVRRPARESTQKLLTALLAARQTKP
jgi:ankyrin repeat protein